MSGAWGVNLSRLIYFLSGLPRTGSTLLGSLLAQNPTIHVTPTSPLHELLIDVNESFNRAALQFTFDAGKSDRVYRALIDAYYADIREPVIFDKNRGWPKSVPAIAEYLNPTPRIIATVRPIAEIVTSYIVLADQDPANFIDAHLRRNGAEITNENRAGLLWTLYIQPSYQALKQGLETHPDSILLVEYDDIVYEPHAVLNRIYAFCDLPHYRHTLTSITNRSTEAKNAWGLRNLHEIRPALSRQSSDPLNHLPQTVVQFLNQQTIKEKPWPVLS